MKKVFRFILISLLPIYLIMAYIFFSDKASGEICKSVQITVFDSIQSPFINKRETSQILKRNGINPVGMKLSRINTQKIETCLLENQLIYRAECYKTPAGILKIDIYQRIPILRIMSTSGNYYVDNTGSIMPVSKYFTAYLPIATGYIEKGFAKKDLYQFALFLQNNKFWNAQIDQIYVNQSQDIELIPRVGDHTILLGSLNNFEKKLENLMRLYKDGFNKMGWNKYTLINLKYENQIICTKRNT